MLRNHLTVAWRNLFKNRLQTGINIIGLAIGIAGCLTVFLLSTYELSFNRTIVDGDRIYRLYTQYNGEFGGVNAGIPTGAATLAATALPGTEVQCMLTNYSAKVEVPYGPKGEALKKFEEQTDVVVTGPEFFDLIQNFEWLAGSPRQSLSEPFQVVLTESKARLYFGMKDAREAVGQPIIYADSLRLTVAGILRDPDFRSDFHFNDFISARTVPGSFLKDQIPQEEWGGTRSADQFFVKAAPGISRAELTRRLATLNERFNVGLEAGDAANEFKWQPLSDLHFNHELGIFDSSRNPAHKSTLYGLMVIAGLLLLIASINFINLATVQATRRSKETGVRKAIGASRGQLTGQFLVETACITLLALPVALLLTQLSLRYFSEFLPEALQLDVTAPGVLLFLCGAVLAVTFLAGLYPSFVLSSFQPAFAIKNQSGSGLGGRSVYLRKGLIVFQFVLAQAFIISAFVMGRQLQYALHHDLGFNKDAIVYFYSGRRQNVQNEALQQQLQRLPEVKAVAWQSKPPLDMGYTTNLMSFERAGEEVKSEVHLRMVDTAYLRLYDIPLVAGRNFLRADSSTEIVINETFAREMGFSRPEEALGAMVEMGKKQLPVAGVVRDFHVQSFHHAIPPVALIANLGGVFSLALKISNEQPLAATLDKIKGVWTEVLPDRDFRYFLLNETVEKLYETEAQTVKLINTAMGLAILLSCLGLFGLAFFMVTQRAREIGIRKVLGASVSGIVGLLSRDFVRLVLIALLVAAPLAWYAMRQWLADFAYRVDIEWWIFALTGLIAVGVAFLTVSFQSVKAALANPVKTLRNE